MVLGLNAQHHHSPAGEGSGEAQSNYSQVGLSLKKSLKADRSAAGVERGIMTSVSWPSSFVRYCSA